MQTVENQSEIIVQQALCQIVACGKLVEKFLWVDRPTLERQKVFPARELRMFRMSMISENVHVKSISNVFHKLRVICPQVFPQLISNPMPPNLILPTVRRRRCSVSLQLAIVTLHSSEVLSRDPFLT